MDNMELGEVQLRFAELVWHYAPLPSGELVKICQRELNWKKPTTYTVLRKLAGKGILKNETPTVTSLVGRRQVQQYETQALLEKNFDGSLPAFLATFLQDRKLTKEEAAELEHMIEEATK